MFENPYICKTFLVNMLNFGTSSLLDNRSCWKDYLLKAETLLLNKRFKTFNMYTRMGYTTAPSFRLIDPQPPYQSKVTRYRAAPSLQRRFGPEHYSTLLKTRTYTDASAQQHFSDVLVIRMPEVATRWSNKDHDAKFDS